MIDTMNDTMIDNLPAEARALLAQWDETESHNRFELLPKGLRREVFDAYKYLNGCDYPEPPMSLPALLILRSLEA